LPPSIKKPDGGDAANGSEAVFADFLANQLLNPFNTLLILSLEIAPEGCSH
jgi:hypothetical protein